MPFPMVHLIIALKILNETSGISKPSEFLLGSIAPDSVHFRPLFDRAMKSISHLQVGDDEYPNTVEWCDNVQKFLKNNKKSENADFIYGYCSHVFTDIRNTILIYKPFRMEHCIKRDSGIISDYLKECCDIDYELFQTYKERDAVLELLKESEGIDIDGLVNVVDLEIMKSHILYEQYAKRVSDESYSYKYITVDRIVNFVNNETEWIEKQLFFIQ